MVICCVVVWRWGKVVWSVFVMFIVLWNWKKLFRVIC